MKKKKILYFGATFLVLLFILVVVYVNISLTKKYASLQSVVVLDRNNATILVKDNVRGNADMFIAEVPENLENALLQKEDRYFYYHNAINPFSIIRGMFNYMRRGKTGGSSTLTQQLVKILLGNEQNRTFPHKIEETLYAVMFEWGHSKKDILRMYVNSAYLGNQLQGFEAASQRYFGTSTKNATDSQIKALVQTLSSPSSQNPWSLKNSEATKKGQSGNNPAAFELSSFIFDCPLVCRTTIDTILNEKIRNIVSRVVEEGSASGAKTSAVVVIKVPENEVVAMVGTPDVHGTIDGHAINMALQPRPIGSTIKPFIYLKAFEKGARPYTEVDDREYKLSIGSGFPLYPKNYDGMYRGTVSMHEALSNSLNIPAVKTLEYVGLNDFYYFLMRGLQFKPLTDLDEYQYGIALGGLDMDPLSLAYFFTIFPNQGSYRSLHIRKDKAYDTTPMSENVTRVQIADPKYIQLVTAIINDRKTGVEQFGLESNLNLSQDNYAVKTGTSRDYHDSWTVGYTPDFVVAVWLGNAENKALKHVTGQSGAGKIWHDTMELLFNSSYNKKTKFNTDEIRTFPINGSLDFGLPGDDVEKYRTVLKRPTLIISPHDGDLVLFDTRTIVPLRSRESLGWYVNDAFLGKGTSIDYTPSSVGTYVIKAVDVSGNTEHMSITLTHK